MSVFIFLHFVLSLVAYVYALEGFKQLSMYHLLSDRPQPADAI